MRKSLILPLLVLLSVFAVEAISGAILQPQPPSELEQIIRNRLQVFRATGTLSASGVPIRARTALPSFYESNEFQPVWIGDQPATNSGVDELLVSLQSATDHGLDPGDYNVERIASLRERQKTNQLDLIGLVDLEFLSTDAFMVYGSHLLNGRVNPEKIEAEWLANRRDASLDSVLKLAISEHDVSGILENLAPKQPRYAALQAALERYRTISTSKPWFTIEDGPKLEYGMTGARVWQVRQRLSDLGDLNGASAVSDSAYTFDRTLEAAVTRFQYRHGLEDDGVVGPATLRALNRTYEERIRQISINLERWRWLPENLGDEHIEVNIPGFSVHVVENGVITREHRAIVGKQYRQTPSFTGKMTYLVLAPYWHVPPTIAAKDKFPLIQKNPGYIAKQNMTLFSAADNRVVDPSSVDWSSLTGNSFNRAYRLRQEPGPNNALGHVKFMFPNKHNVYLHDTPSRELFASSSRGFSSGCIRVENPLDLAAHLLRDKSEWSANRINSIAKGTVETSVTLGRTIPVHLLYWTAWADADGTIHFRDDIYGRDEAVYNALLASPPGP